MEKVEVDKRLLRWILADINFLLIEAYDTNVDGVSIEGLKDTIEDIRDLLEISKDKSLVEYLNESA